MDCFCKWKTVMKASQQSYKCSFATWKATILWLCCTDEFSGLKNRYMYYDKKVGWATIQGWSQKHARPVPRS